MRKLEQNYIMLSQSTGGNGMTKTDIESMTPAEKEMHVRNWVGDIVLHFKGDKYLILNIATDTVSNLKVVVYKALYGACEVYTRPIQDVFMWVEDREDNVTSNKIRFEPVSLMSVKERNKNAN